MARFDADSTTGGQVSTDDGFLLAVTFKADKENSDYHFIGRSDVAVGAGYPLDPGESLTADFAPGSARLSDFHTTGRGKVHWFAVFEF